MYAIPILYLLLHMPLRVIHTEIVDEWQFSGAMVPRLVSNLEVRSVAVQIVDPICSLRTFLLSRHVLRNPLVLKGKYGLLIFSSVLTYLQDSL
jgi:hypothetical protein